MLSDKALLVSVVIHQWTARKLDRKATRTVCDTHKTDTNAGNYTKRLLPGARSLERVHSAAQALRVWFYEQTLPWCVDGARILPSASYIEFTKALRERKAAFDDAVKAFLQEYDTLRTEAQTKLGDLFNEREYPSVNAIPYLFECEVMYMPMPEVGDFRVELLDSEKASFEKQIRDAEANAKKECWNRLYEVVSKAVSKLADPSAQLRASLLENIHEICSVLPKLNVTEDTSLETLRKQVEEAAKGIHLESCKISREERTNAARNLKEVMDKMNVFMNAG